MTRLLAAAPPDLDEPAWRRDERHEALEAFRAQPLPDTAEEVWKYAPIDKLALDDVELATPEGDGPVVTSVGGEVRSAVIAVSAGALRDARVAEGTGVTVTFGAPERPAGLVGADDAFAALNLALSPGTLVVSVADGAILEAPVVLVVDATPGASLPRVLVRVGAGARARVLEHHRGAAASLVAGVAEYVVGDGAALSVATVQSLGPQAWSIQRTRATLGRGAGFTQAVVGLGARYDRVRADAVLEGEGATSTLTTAHVGRGDQVHDLRTMQVHRGARTTSRLRSKAAVSGAAGSIYSGLIAMRHGARKADASQVNASLVLSGRAYADAIPNLDIEENDVRCTHASSVGPIDAEQRWYLESRGVAPTDAVRLILEGFFVDVEASLGDAALVADVREAIGELDVEAT